MHYLAVVLLILGTGCREDRRAARVAAVAPAPAAGLTEALPAAATPYIPPQCYVKTEDEQGRVHNPCFACHVSSPPPNYIDDGSLQLGYAFGPPALKNPWTNLFVDRRAAVAAIGDATMLAYVRQDNYPGLVARLAALPAEWDSNGDGSWNGWTPDVAFDFDERGFDRGSDGAYTGWRVYAYFPLPGAFWPSNGGSFGDVAVRLPALFREDVQGRFDAGVYAVNLAILEAMIGRHDVVIEAVGERELGVDLDGDGRLGRARKVRYRWKPGVVDLTWAGRAGVEGVRLSAGLFPVGTELVHSLRYLDVEGDEVKMAARLKELRYMVKTSWVSYGALEHQAGGEAREKEQTPEETRVLVGSREGGISNRAGWRLQGFIEDAAGELRPQTHAEQTFCIGCHSGVGATDDSVFSFGRKLPADGFRRGWYHWSDRGFSGLGEPRRADGRGEYTLYLEENRAGDDLRANDELQMRFFAGGELRADWVLELARDVSPLLLPSPARALLLDKAYRVIVGEQTFVRGRDPTLVPAVHVHRELPAEEQSTGVKDVVSDRRRPAQVARRR